MMDEELARARKMAALAMKKEEAEREQSGDGLPARQEALQRALETLGVGLERLEQRLQPVLRDPEPTAALHATPRDQVESPLAAFLRGATGHAEDLAGRLGDLSRRVDL